MERIEFSHGGPTYDEKYPDGIPTTLEIVHRTLGTLSSGLVMYPEGHARNTSGNLKSLLEAKFRLLAGQGVADVDELYRRFTGFEQKTAADIARLYDFPILGLPDPRSTGVTCHVRHADPPPPPKGTPAAAPKPLRHRRQTGSRCQRDRRRGSAPGQRLVSLDAYRGLTMFAMASGGIGLRQVAQQFPDSPVWQPIGYQPEHVPWVGCSVWDMIQPSFMFIVGVAMVFSCASRAAHGQSWGRMAWHAAWRSVVLVLLGIFLRSADTPHTNFMFEDVLTQIGLGYFFLFLLWNQAAGGAIRARRWPCWPAIGCCSIPIRCRRKVLIIRSVNVPANWQHLTGIAAHWDKNTNVAAAFDQLVDESVSPRVEPFIASPGGYQTLNFIPSLATMIFGLLAGGLLQSEQSAWRKVRLAGRGRPGRRGRWAGAWTTGVFARWSNGSGRRVGRCSAPAGCC